MEGSGSLSDPVIQPNSSDSLAWEAKMTQLLGLLTPGSTATLSLPWSANTLSSVLVHLKLLFVVKDWQSNSKNDGGERQASAIMGFSFRLSRSEQHRTRSQPDPLI